MKTLKEQVADGDIQIKLGGEWQTIKWDCIRVKPKPMEIWVNVYDKGVSYAYRTEGAALESRTRAKLRAVKFIEVIE